MFVVDFSMYLFETLVVHGKIDQTLVNSLHGLPNCEIGGLDSHVITTEYGTRVHLYKHVTPIFVMHWSM